MHMLVTYDYINIIPIQSPSYKPEISNPIICQLVPEGINALNDFFILEFYVKIKI